VLDTKYPSCETCLVIVGKNRHDCLSDNRPGIDLRANEMHGTTAEPNARRQCLTLRVQTGKGGQKRGMDIDHPVAPRFDKGTVQHAHESGQADKLDPLLMKQGFGSNRK